MPEYKFVDHARITVRGGNGGNGCMSFRREKYIPRGGPDGGDGGDGGNVIFIADADYSTLSPFRYKRHFFAKNGEHGRGANCSGKDGEDLVIRVPLGTWIQDTHTGEVVGDLVHQGQVCCVARGGKGGRGNTHFKNAKMRAPRIAENGVPGEERELSLELKLIADVGLIGMPNAGKSTIISKVSNARPKIADYPFTTLTPNLGVVQLNEKDAYLVADIPGIIEGASEGAGLGIRFLKHVERTLVVAHVVDISQTMNLEPVEDYRKIRQELARFSQNLSQKEEIIVLNKIDLISDQQAQRWKDRFIQEGNEVVLISAATGVGIQHLKQILWNGVQRHQRSVEEKEEFHASYKADEKMDFAPLKEKMPHSVTLALNRIDEHTWELGGEELDLVCRKLNLNHYDSYRLLMEIVQRSGVDALLKKHGVPSGATVRIGTFEFEYLED